jgi:RNA polymerase sigma-70 factor (ECF subfamily)
MEAIVDIVEKPVRAYLALTAGPGMSIDDLAQEALITGLKNVGSIRNPDQLVSFFQGAAKNKLRAEFRKQGRRDQLLEGHVEQIMHNLGMLPNLSVETPRDGGVDRRHQALLRCLKKVPEQNRKLLVDYYCSHVSTEQIAASSNRKCEAVRALLYRLRKRLRACITGEMQTIQEVE